MKSGSAVRVQDDCSPQMVTAIESPMGEEVKSAMPTMAVASSAAPTQTPRPRRKKSVVRKMTMEMVSLMLPPAPLRFRG